MSQSVRAAAQRSSKSAIGATFLSFLWPGLGQAYLGRRRVAVLFAVPPLLVLLVALWEARDGLDVLIARVLLVPSAATALAVSAIALGFWRLASMAAAALDPRAQRPQPERADRVTAANARIARRRRWAFMGVLVAIVFVSHGVIAWTGLAFLDASSHVYVSGEPGRPQPSDDIGSRPTPWATPVAGGRINVLLIGADSGLGYTHSLTDTLILVSVDPTAKKVDMISFPRDIARFRLYSGGTYNDKINSLLTHAARHPDEFPDGGIGTLAQEIGYLIGVPIQYYAFVNLAGFKSVIDALGGIDIVNERDIADPGYQFPDHQVGFFLTAGPHHLDGRTALAYVRSRNGPGDSDFTRARRQQQLLVALRDRLTSPSMLLKLPTVLQSLAAAVQTDYPANGVPDLIQLAKQIPQDSVTHYVLGPPYATRPAQYAGSYILVIDEQKVAALSIRLFGASSRYSVLSGSPSP